jgi:hypothetical protein
LLALAVVEGVKDSLGVGQGGGNRIDGQLVEGTGEAECLVPAPLLEGSEREEAAGSDDGVEAFAVGLAEQVTADRRAGKDERIDHTKASKIGSGGVVLACDEGQGGEIPLGPEGDLVRADRGMEAEQPEELREAGGTLAAVAPGEAAEVVGDAFLPAGLDHVLGGVLVELNNAGLSVLVKKRARIEQTDLRDAAFGKRAWGS